MFQSIHTSNTIQATIKLMVHVESPVDLTRMVKLDNTNGPAEIDFALR